ncbi:MAG: hypothetical protein CVV44_11240 [Spirochaetae bacterium HGW-Spirochaetae-1]|jgi:AcrR family transcriptional regulator|nr:MAG: hypothetical protein CVV44_11240 [Spirochaetae bacterium HGW-Spirochaetae-1]
MAEKTRINAEERRQRIIEAAKPLFADFGFNGTSIRDIAKAADVSNALLYKHFPSKEAMYEEILSYTDYIIPKLKRKLEELEPSTQTLVFLSFAFFRFILFEAQMVNQDQKRHERLLFYSLLENLNYARKTLRRIHDDFEKMIKDNFIAAEESGDIIKSENNVKNRFWFMHHLAMGVNLCHVSGEPAFNYDTSYRELVEDAVCFVLRGIGLTDRAIKKYYKPEKLEQQINSIF